MGEWDVEGFHLIAVERSDAGTVLEIESCDPVAGCPGCGVAATGHGRVVVKGFDAPWAGAPVRIRWCERRWMRLENTCETVTFTEQNRAVRAPRALLGVRTIRWATRQLRFERATIVGLARQLAARGTRCGPTSNPCSPQLLMICPVSQACGCWGVTRVWHYQGRRRRGPRELTGIMDLTRGGDRPTARLLDPVPGRWRGLPQLAGRARRAVPLRGTIETLDPVPRGARTPSMTSPATPPASQAPSISSSPPVTRAMRCAAGTGKTPWATDLPHPRDRPSGPVPAKVERRVLAHLDPGRTSNGPTEAINGIIELGRRTARGYRNHNNHRLRNLLEADGPARHLHRKM